MIHDIDNELKLMLEGRFEESKAISDKLQELGKQIEDLNTSLSPGGQLNVTI